MAADPGRGRAVIAKALDWLLFESLSLVIKLFITIRNDLNYSP